MSLQAEIVTPRAVAWRGTANDVQAPGLLGEFGVLPQHIPFLTVLRPGRVTIRGADGTKRFVVGEGFTEAGPSRVVILADTCEDVDGIDLDAARKQLAEAEKLLAHASAGSAEAASARREIALARARVG